MYIDNLYNKLAELSTLLARSFSLSRHTHTLHNKGRIQWSLKFLLPPPTRLPNAPPTADSPLTAQSRAMLQLFQCRHYFLALPDPTAEQGEIRQVKLGYKVHPEIANWLLSWAPMMVWSHGCATDSSALDSSTLRGELTYRSSPCGLAVLHYIGLKNM